MINIERPVSHQLWNSCRMGTFNRGGTWTRNLRIRSPTPYPLGHTTCKHIGRKARSVKTNITMMYLNRTGSWADESSLDHLQYFTANASSARNKKLRFYILKEFFYPTRSYIILQQDSPLTGRIDRALQLLMETGFIDYHRSKFVKKLNDFMPEVNIEPFSLNCFL